MRASGRCVLVALVSAIFAVVVAMAGLASASTTVGLPVHKDAITSTSAPMSTAGANHAVASKPDGQWTVHAHRYDDRSGLARAFARPADYRLAPQSIPRSGPIPQSLGAASRAEQLAKKLHLNVNSPTTHQVLNSLDDNVADFVGNYRKGNIWRELPGEVAEMSVEDALRHSSTVRKLLIDNRFVK